MGPVFIYPTCPQPKSCLGTHCLYHDAWMSRYHVAWISWGSSSQIASLITLIASLGCELSPNGETEFLSMLFPDFLLSQGSSPKLNTCSLERLANHLSPPPRMQIMKNGWPVWHMIYHHLPTAHVMACFPVACDRATSGKIGNNRNIIIAKSSI